MVKRATKLVPASSGQVSRTGPVPPVESVITGQILDALHWRKDLLVWRQNTGVARLVGKGGKIRPVRFGVPGAADISGLIRPGGRRLEIEVKRPKPFGAPQSEDQKLFAQRIENCGGLYLLVTGVEDCFAQLRAAGVSP